MVLGWLSKVLDVADSASRETTEQSVQHQPSDTAHSMPDITPESDSSCVNRILGMHELLRVFDFLSPSDVASRAALVCRRW